MMIAVDPFQASRCLSVMSMLLPTMTLLLLLLFPQTRWRGRCSSGRRCRTLGLRSRVQRRPPRPRPSGCATCLCYFSSLLQSICGQHCAFESACYSIVTMGPTSTQQTRAAIGAADLAGKAVTLTALLRQRAGRRNGAQSSL